MCYNDGSGQKPLCWCTGNRLCSVHEGQVTGSDNLKEKAT